MPHRAGHDSTPSGPPSSGSRRRYAPSPGEIKAITGIANAPGGIFSIQEPQSQSQPPSGSEKYSKPDPRPDPVDNSLKFSFQPDPYAFVKAGNNNFDASVGLMGAGFTTKNNPFRFTGGKGFGPDNEDYLRLMYDTGLGETGINRLNANYDLLNNQGNLGVSVPVDNFNFTDSGIFLPGDFRLNSSVTGDGISSPTFSYNQSFLPKYDSTLGNFIEGVDGSISMSANQDPTFNLGTRVDPVGGIANLLGYDSSKIDRSLKPALDLGMSYILGDNSPQFNVGFGF